MRLKRLKIECNTIFLLWLLERIQTIKKHRTSNTISRVKERKGRKIKTMCNRKPSSHLRQKFFDQKIQPKIGKLSPEAYEPVQSASAEEKIAFKKMQVSKYQVNPAGCEK